MAKLDVDTQSAAELNRLLDQALELPVPERLAWLDTNPEIPLGLKGKLRDLLLSAPSVETGDFLDTLPKVGREGEQRDARASLAPASVVGPYRLSRELGQGGMGSVWLAERVDGLVKRAVALKLPHVSWSRAGLAERMAREREILASLEHPHIARLYDAGLTTDGQPYLALEYVEGLPIDRYCAGDTQRPALDVRARLRLFVQVANAVAYAHGKLVLHRDLKPANVLVTDEGYVRLLDFGIAKMLDEGQPSKSKLTELSGRALTPDYASPEQILDEPLGVTSDVYSLGVVLYELLAGTRPYKLARDSRRALEDAILQAEPALVSTMAPAADRALLRGDLDTILAKALKKDPVLRYPSVADFAEDIERHLAYRPVIARPDSTWYRAGKFARRNVLAVSAACVVLTAVAVASVVSLLQAQRADAERIRAEAVKDFIVAMFERANPGSGGSQSVTASELVRQASQDIMTSDLEDPHARAEISRVLGTTLLHLRDIEAADRTATVALSVAREQFPSDHIEVLRARLLRAQVLRYKNDLARMRAELAEILPLMARLSNEYPRDFIAANSAKTALEIESVHYDAAVESAKTVVRLTAEHLGSNSLEYAAALRGLSQAYVFAGDADNGMEFARLSFDRLRSAHKGNTAHPDVIDSRVILALALGSNGAFAEAIENLEAAIADAISVWGPDNTKVGFHLQQSVNYYLSSGQPKKALAAAARSFEILESSAPRSSMTYVAGQFSIGKSLVAVGRGAEAEAIMGIVAAEAANLFGAKHRNTFDARALHAFTVAEAGDLLRATTLVAECQADMQQAPNVVTSFPTLVQGQIERRASNLHAAIRLLEASVAEGSTLKEPAQRGLAAVEIGLAQIQNRQATLGRASLIGGLDLLEKSGHMSTPIAAQAVSALSQLDATEGNAVDALRRAEQVAEFWREFDAQHREAVRARAWLRSLREISARRS